TGLTPVSISGTGWTCAQPAGQCNRNDALAAGASYPAITLTVNVPINAPASVTNTVTVAGGGEANTANDQANDSTNINSLETVSTPIVPSGVSTGLTGTSYAFYASGAVSSLSHQLQYQFTWGDGTNSGWLPAGVTRTSHTWTTPGTYSVTTQARCAQD